MKQDPREHKSVRRLRAEDDRHFLIMVLATLVLAGGAIIALIFGPAALLTALPFLLLGAGLIIIPYLLLTVIEKLLKRL